MELRINLDNREEVAAGVSLLQMFLAGAVPPQMPAAVEAELRAVLQGGLATPPYSSQAADTRAPLTSASASPELATGGFLTAPDPAAVFGGAPAVVPLPPSIPTSATPSIVVPPPPANIAPTIPTPGPAGSGAVASSVELDSKGLPWDERIHSSGKTRVKGDVWRVKGGVPPERVAQVEAELRAAMGNALPAAPTVTTQAPAMAVGASSPTITASLDPATFEQLMPRITAAVVGGLLPATAVGEACTINGLPSVVALQQNPQFVPLVWASLKQQHPALQ